MDKTKSTSKRGEEQNQQDPRDQEIADLNERIDALARLIETRIQTFAPVAGTPTINGYIPAIIDGKTHKLATVA